MGVEKEFKLGKKKIIILEWGSFKVDGGVLFGMIPKSRWGRQLKSDDDNLVELGLRSILIETSRTRILVDTGFGDKLSDDIIDKYHIKGEDVRSCLGEANLTLDDIDEIILTHLHTDHAGGNTYMDYHKKVHPTFPDAKYIVQRQEWEEAIHLKGLTENDYNKDDYLPLLDSVKLKLVHGHYFVIPGVSTWLTGGHTTGHQIVRVTSKGETLIFLGDLVPTRFHFDLKYTSAYDMFPLTIYEVKRNLIEDAIEEDWFLVLQHDPEVSVCKLRGDVEDFEVEAVEM